MGIERDREIRRRRSRKKKVNLLKNKADQATPTERAVIAAKLRKLTSGADVLIERWELEERN